MSANIYWEPVVNRANDLHVSAPSWFMESLERADMGLPHVFGSGDIPVLKGLAAAMRDDPNPFKQLIEAIEKHDKVEVWYEY
jgi:hypothetical protein